MSKKFTKFWDIINPWLGHRHILNQLMQLENEKKEDDHRLAKLEKATIDGDEKWFRELIKKDPECVLRVFEECKQK